MNNRRDFIMLNDDLIYSEDVIDYFKIRMTTLLLRIVYPSILGLFISKDTENVDMHLRNVAETTASSFLKIIVPKGNDPKEIVEKISKLWGRKYTIKRDKNSIIIRTKHCPLCEEMPTLELKGHHYCNIVGIFTEVFLNQIHSYKDPKKFKFSDFKVKTTTSKGSGDDRCEYIITYEKRG